MAWGDSWSLGQQAETLLPGTLLHDKVDELIVPASGKPQLVASHIVELMRPCVPFACGFCHPCYLPPTSSLAGPHPCGTVLCPRPLCGQFAESTHRACLEGDGLVGCVCCGGFGSASCFQMGFSRDDRLAVGSSVKHLRAANCFGLIRA